MPRSFELAVSLLVIFILSGCVKWPPEREKITNHVQDRREQIRVLVEEFRGAEYGRIVCRNCLRIGEQKELETVSYKLRERKWHFVENPNDEHFAELMKAAGISGISVRSDGSTELELPVSAGENGRAYVIQLFHNPGNHVTSYPECIGDFKKIDCGWCKVSVDDDLAIRYGWYPEDLDPDATRALNDGEIDFSEWERRDKMALEACETQGLIDLGFKPQED